MNSQPNTMLAAQRHFSDTVEELRDKHGWDDNTYMQIMNAGMRLSNAKNTMFLSSTKLDETFGKNLTDEMVKVMWDDGEVVDENSTNEILTKRPFNLEMAEEDDLLVYGSSLITAFRRDLTRYALEKEKQRIRAQNALNENKNNNQRNGNKVDKVDKTNKTNCKNANASRVNKRAREERNSNSRIVRASSPAAVVIA